MPGAEFPENYISRIRLWFRELHGKIVGKYFWLECTLETVFRPLRNLIDWALNCNCHPLGNLGCDALPFWKNPPPNPVLPKQLNEKTCKEIPLAKRTISQMVWAKWASCARFPGQNANLSHCTCLVTCCFPPQSGCKEFPAFSIDSNWLKLIEMAEIWSAQTRFSKTQFSTSCLFGLSSVSGACSCYLQTRTPQPNCSLKGNRSQLQLPMLCGRTQYGKITEPKRKKKNGKKGKYGNIGGIKGKKSERKNGKKTECQISEIT